MFKITKVPRDYIEIDLFDNSYDQYGGFNQWISKTIEKCFGIFICEANITFHHDYVGFGIEHWYYDWYNHGIKFGYITLYWCGYPEYGER